MVHASPLCESVSVEKLLPPAIDTDVFSGHDYFANIPPMQDARVPIQQDGLAFAATG